MKKKMISVLLCVLLLFCAGGCNLDFSDEIKYPDYPLTSDAKDSWTYIEEEFTVNWYVGVDGFSEFDWGKDTVSSLIKEKLGVTINWITTSEDYELYLSTLIASDSLPDIVSISASSVTGKMMASENKVYPISELAKRWAPSLLARLEADSSDMVDYYTAESEDLFWLPSHTCVEADKEDVIYSPEGAIMVRKDMFDWFCAKYPNVDVMHADGFYEMIKAVSDTFGYKTGLGGKVDGIDKVKNLRGIELASITTEDKSGITYLSQYFAAPYENAGGNYVDSRTTPQYKEALAFLNTCYQNGYVTEANLVESMSEAGSVIANGRAFAFSGKPQDYTNYFTTAKNVNDIEYIPLIVTNKAGEDPVLKKDDKYGYMYNMITSKAKRPDLIIKLFDFLWSDEGQLLSIYGEEDVAWNWTDESKSKIVLTETMQQYKAEWNANYLQYGANKLWMLTRKSFNAKIYPDNGWTVNEKIKENFKRPLVPVSYTYNYFYPMASIAGVDKKMTRNASNIEAVWKENIASILMSNNFETTYSSVISMMKTNKLDDLTVYYNASYQKLKSKMGITYGWVLNDPDFTSAIKDNNGNYKISPNGDSSYLVTQTAIDEALRG